MVELYGGRARELLPPRSAGGRIVGGGVSKDIFCVY